MLFDFYKDFYECSRTKEKGKKKKSDQTVAEKFVDELVKQLPKAAGNIQFVFLDSWFDENDREERESYMESFDTLQNLLKNSGMLLTSKINENIKSERRELKLKILEETKQIDKLWL